MAAHGDQMTIRIIIPVFRDLDATRGCLASLAESDLPVNTSVQVIDDCSPEPDLSRFCAEFCSSRGWAYRANAENLGFVATANRGLAEHDGDVILLNSDTRVHGDWVQRLARCAYADERTGTVTPFSNDATICSYPVFQAPNALPAGWTAQALDELFSRANRGLRQALPTAVGFCMYIRRACLDDVGAFDEDNFGRGYGEECDFSMRAERHGWSNQLAADVFVYHQGSASFGGESRELKTAADQVMVALYPEWEKRVTEFLTADSLQPLRANVDALRLAERPGDLGAVLDEHAQYARSILDRFAALETARDENRREIAALNAEREQLGRLLDECREQFAVADEALGRAHETVAQMGQDLARQRHELDLALDRARDLDARLTLMENSRSWRYTAWLRRGEGSE